jgi:hypothetical protein
MVSMMREREKAREEEAARENEERRLSQRWRKWAWRSENEIE